MEVSRDFDAFYYMSSVWRACRLQFLGSVRFVRVNSYIMIQNKVEFKQVAQFTEYPDHSSLH